MSATFGLIAGTVFTMIGSFEKLQVMLMMTALVFFGLW